MPETRRQKKKKKKKINKKLGLVENCCYFFHILDLKSDLNIKMLMVLESLQLLVHDFLLILILRKTGKNKSE